MHRRLENVYYEVREPRLSWDDIGGAAAVKERLREMVCLPFARRASLDRMGVVPPAGVMMWGPLGNGITMLAEACARELAITYFCISGREMLGKAEDMEEAFGLALQEAPCLLYVADVDWLAPRAGADYRWEDGDERGKPPTFADPELTRRFVACLDRVAGKRDLVLLGACYRIDVVDQSVLRDKDRFNRKVFVPPPSTPDRRDMLRLFARRFPLEEVPDLDRWAERTQGLVGWDMENLLKKAALAAVASGRERIGEKDLEAALGQVRPWLTPAMTRGYFSIYEKDCPHHYTF